LHDDGWSRFLARLAAAAAGDDAPTYPIQRPDERLTTLRRQRGSAQG